MSRVKNFVVEWNKRYPIDHWWRKKYNIPFGSKQHREMTLLDMLIDFEEDRMYQKYKEKLNSVDEGEIDFFKDNKTIEMSEKEIEKEYEDLDISQFNDKE